MNPTPIQETNEIDEIMFKYRGMTHPSSGIYDCIEYSEDLVKDLTSLLQRKEREAEMSGLKEGYADGCKDTIKRVMEVRPGMHEITRKNFSYDLQEWNNALQEWTDNITNLNKEGLTGNITELPAICLTESAKQIIEKLK